MKIILTALSILIATQADAACRKALAIGMDVSGSVDAREYSLQYNGLAGALADTTVREALLNFPDIPVELMVFEWSGPEYQIVVIPWTTINSAEVLSQTISRLKRATELRGNNNSNYVYSGADVNSRRYRRDPQTAIGNAMLFGSQQLRHRPCWTQTLDLSGDGVSNLGSQPQEALARINNPNLTINALAIVSDDASPSPDAQPDALPLPDYFRREVISGPGSFVEVAKGFADFQSAMARKLLREVEDIAVSRLDLKL